MRATQRSILVGVFVGGLLTAATACSVIVNNKLKDKDAGGSATADAGQTGTDSGPDGVCQGAADCEDGDPCNGAETCAPGMPSADGRGCLAGMPALDGTECDSDGNPDTRDLCLRSECRASTCGDGFHDRMNMEECDDGPQHRDNDGCTDECRFSCHGGAECDPCDGFPMCNMETHRCEGDPATLPDGRMCPFFVPDMAPRAGQCCNLSCCDGICETTTPTHRCVERPRP